MLVTHAREGLGYWLMEAGDVCHLGLCQPLATQLYKWLKSCEPSVARKEGAWLFRMF